MREQLSHVKSRFSDTECERLEAVAAYQSLQSEVESAAERTEKLQCQLMEQTQLVQEIQQQCDRLQSQNRVSVLLYSSYSAYPIHKKYSAALIFANFAS